MKKVIVKYKINSRDNFIKKLKGMELEPRLKYYQHDRVYVPRTYKPDANYARMVLRTELKDVNQRPRYRMILKRHIADSGVDIINSTIVKDYSEAVHIVHQLGFEKKAEIARQREEVRLGEGSKMYIDKIENLPGYYVKIEDEVGDDEKIGELRDDIMMTFEMLGMEAGKEIKDAYADIRIED